MNKLMKNTIKYGLGLTAILVVGILTLTPNNVQAKDRPGYYSKYNKDFVDTTYYSNATYAGYNPYPETIATGSVLGTSTSSTTQTTEKVTTKDSSTVDYKEIKEEFSDVTANALFGADSFFPTSLMGWLLFAIFVLVIVVLVRKFAGLEKKYHAAPLKSA
jgi:hypothetical protein